jgi:predicted RNase H-like HicB family nuclease
LLIGRRAFYNEGLKRKISRDFSYSVFYEQVAEGQRGFVPALPGCHTQGETLEETKRNVKEAIALYLESLVVHGGSHSRGWAIVSGISMPA